MTGLLALTMAAAAGEPEPVLHLRDEPGQPELVLDLGPLQLPAGAGHHGVRQPMTQWVRVPRRAACCIT